LVPVSIPCWIVLNFPKSNSLLANTSSNSHNNCLSGHRLRFLSGNDVGRYGGVWITGP
jgi:hypothetical protein